jgi:FkbM family methyltransferase
MRVLPDFLKQLVQLNNPILLYCSYGRGKVSHLLHIGAHELEELPLYSSLGITQISWVEANHLLESKMRARDSEARILFRAVTNLDDSNIVLNLSSNSVSSSIYHLNKGHFFDNVSEVGSLNVSTVTLDSTFAWANHEGGERVDSLVIDVQGSEGRILQADSKCLREIRMLIIEVSHKQIYSGSIGYEVVKRKLRKSGLIRVATFLNPLNGHGDELWINFWSAPFVGIRVIFVSILRRTTFFFARIHEQLSASNKNQ